MARNRVSTEFGRPIDGGELEKEELPLFKWAMATAKG